MRSGRVWKFGDNINTDLMLPGSVLYSSPEQQARAVFINNRPGWVDQVQNGDAIVGGFNYGMGSSRPAARSLRNCGVGFLLAETINGLFFRNAVNYGLLACECSGVSTAFEEGDAAELDIDAWTARAAKPRCRKGASRKALTRGKRQNRSLQVYCSAQGPSSPSRRRPRRGRGSKKSVNAASGFGRKPRIRTAKVLNR